MTDQPLPTLPSKKDVATVDGESSRTVILSEDESQIRRDALDYVVQLSGELAAIARDSHFDLIAYFLEMAVMEAAATRRKLTR